MTCRHGIPVDKWCSICEDEMLAEVDQVDDAFVDEDDLPFLGPDDPEEYDDLEDDVSSDD